MLFCNHCGSIIGEEDVYCGCCGTKINRFSGMESGNEESSEHKRFCPVCGTENPVFAKFCRICGSRLPQQESESPLPGMKPPKVSKDAEYSCNSYDPYVSYSRPQSAVRKSLKSSTGDRLLRIGKGIAAIAGSRQKKGAKKSGVKNEADRELSPAVSFTMMAPAAFEPGVYTKIRLFMFEAAFRYIVDEERTKLGDTEEDSGPALSEIPVGSLITAELHNSDGVVFNHDKIELTWNGQYIIFPFAAKIPADYSESNICIDATISVNHFPYIKMQILPMVNAAREQKLRLVHRFVKKAFISYSHKDINEVLLIYDIMKKCCPKTHYFFDKMDIPTGHRWSRVIQEQIDCSEVFYLCWSRNAKESEEVTKEWTYAIEKHGIDVIDPIPLELIESCNVPEELAGIQFNTNTMFIKEFYRE